MKNIELEAVYLEDSWMQILGNSRLDMSDLTRRKRWEEWKKIAKEHDAEDFVDYWSDNTACTGCIHQDKDWCKYSQLPCTVNPVLTYRHNIMGMACMGLGKKQKHPKQLVLW